MVQSIRALQMAEVITGGSVRKAIGITSWDVQRIEDAQTFNELREPSLHLLLKRIRQIPEQTTESMTPNLLSNGEMQAFQRLFNSLMSSETGPLMVAMISTQIGLGQIP
jgi:hypothetical protein